MNRREFSTSMAALFAAPALPLTAVTPVAAASQSLPPATYLWADMIARARGTVDAGFLARRLRLSPEMAQTLMQQMVSDGVVKAPGIGGLAKAVKPYELNVVASHPAKATALDIETKLKDAMQTLDEISEESHGQETAEETHEET